MVEGELVVVLSQVKKVNNVLNNKHDLLIGTFIGHLQEKKVMVLLPSGDIFVGLEREIAAHAEQVYD